MGTASRAKRKKKTKKPSGLLNMDLFRIRSGLKAVGELGGVKFAYAVVKNARKVGTLCEDLEGAKAPSKAYTEYDKARDALARKHATVNGNSRPTTKGNEYVIVDQAAFDKAVAALQDEHEAALIEQQEKEAGFLELLMEPAEPVDFYTIPVTTLPDDITPAQLQGIFEIVEETE